MFKIVLNCQLIVKQAVNKQNCDQVALIMIHIDTLTAKGVYTEK